MSYKSLKKRVRICNIIFFNWNNWNWNNWNWNNWNWNNWNS